MTSEQMVCPELQLPSGYFTLEDPAGPFTPQNCYHLLPSKMVSFYQAPMSELQYQSEVL